MYTSIKISDKVYNKLSKLKEKLNKDSFNKVIEFLIFFYEKNNIKELDEFEFNQLLQLCDIYHHKFSLSDKKQDISIENAKEILRQFDNIYLNRKQFIELTERYPIFKQFFEYRNGYYTVKRDLI